MTRPHAPPPCWSGRGPPGALTKALVLVRNAVLAVLIVEMMALTAPPFESGNAKPRPPMMSLEHCAQAPDEPAKPANNAAAPRSECLRTPLERGQSAEPDKHCSIRHPQLTRLKGRRYSLQSLATLDEK